MLLTTQELAQKINTALLPKAPRDDWGWISEAIKELTEYLECISHQHILIPDHLTCGDLAFYLEGWQRIGHVCTDTEEKRDLRWQNGVSWHSFPSVVKNGLRALRDEKIASVVIPLSS